MEFKFTNKNENEMSQKMTILVEAMEGFDFSKRSFFGSLSSHSELHF